MSLAERNPDWEAIRMTDDHRRAEENPSSKDKDVKLSNRITRREWLAEVGMAALATGLPAGLEAAHPGGGTSSSLTPPGLYTPSSEHLGHVLASDELFHPAPAGSETDYAQPVSGRFRPLFFSEDEFQAVRRIIELMLGLPPEGASQNSEAAARISTNEQREDPIETVSRWIDLRMASAAEVRRAARTLSPEHKMVAAHYYGPEAVHRLETEEPDRTWREGLAWVEQQSRQRYGDEFLRLTESQQTEILTLANGAAKVETGGGAGSRFFELIKSEVIRGYYTSRRGLDELDYKGNSFYPESPGCPARHP
jgi:hypothetical protein